MQQLNSLQDPFGFDLFVSVEVYEEIIQSLAGLYFQLWFAEQNKPLPLRNSDFAAECLKKSRQIRALRRNYKLHQIAERDEASEHYAKELKTVRATYF
ncbi:hypothetical protein J2Y45_006776 [Dyadobacter sp. BE34]|uniref:Uncharacterized protein n=1 Tax=Dyadobacter fermentans TaxID=94254 RepID=A0ABU1R9W3_9BACT|nr:MULTISPECIES: hypothetical protein [Dyadobacter]MDR6809735.1 hypothetical protein [Dyadobacter fermentans]MDR7047443.1 hypothetical protein [Dyadobacter sp. BE242]MDR7201612.1 hypothetical protein [Dyadobacter sp. BE34]MDR7219482.1 hypothetical protein [Dyadobacter sp. BE31]MDR7267249.1 hypothetical protein [Dyadobacter sp. BE32]